MENISLEGKTNFFEKRVEVVSENGSDVKSDREFLPWMPTSK